MKKTILLALLLSIAVVNTLGQDKKQDESSSSGLKGSSSSESTPTKQEIPNWTNIPRNAISSTPDTSLDNAILNTVLGSDISGSNPYWIGSGSGGKDNNCFNEDSRNKGYPIGWITNSDVPLLLFSDIGSCIEIDEAQLGLYIGKYVMVSPDTGYRLHLAYDGSAEVQLSFDSFSNINGVLAANANQFLPAGRYDDYTVDFQTAADTERLLIRLNMASTGRFTLNCFGVEGVTK